MENINLKQCFVSEVNVPAHCAVSRNLCTETTLLLHPHFIFFFLNKSVLTGRDLMMPAWSKRSHNAFRIKLCDFNRFLQ